MGPALSAAAAAATGEGAAAGEGSFTEPAGAIPANTALNNSFCFSSSFFVGGAISWR